MSNKMQPEKLATLHEQLKHEIADSEFESASATLARLIKSLNNLPENWQESQQWVKAVADADQYLTEIQPTLEAEQEKARAAMSKITKSKKGVKAYTR
ncbi:hypothetical protein DFO83_101398 [Idiomarina loihiensis]|uniref:hypothetical protein n=1 Tax=Idiomarina TaxID=135575 RepID=UPI000D87096E|nr:MULTISPECIES: hypothetical protein [Idiomarina]PWW41703.1 hypothetical protein DFO83_101398 [Idiomarina loihiensis]TDP50761.1 hypothetical protein DET58_101398 [Idiomarina loihiensis]TDS24961.1 hypothetical protein DET62_10141 [Idiomarina sp. H2]